MKTKLRFFIKSTEAKAHDGIKPSAILFCGEIPMGFTTEFMNKYALSLKKIDRAFVKSGFGPSTKEDLSVLIWTEESDKIHFTEVEKMSGMNRIAWAEKLILDLDKQGHEGAQSWLINYGHGERASELRANYENSQNIELTFHHKEEAYFD